MFLPLLSPFIFKLYVYCIYYKLRLEQHRLGYKTQLYHKEWYGFGREFCSSDLEFPTIQNVESI